METLPPEIVQIVSENLTPQDLARCCAVSPKWREIFDQDWLWKKYCDPALEEPLRTVPSVVEPVFVSPEVENSTLPEISKWRLAFLRQKHLFTNLKRDNHIIHFPDIYNDSACRGLPFISETLIVNWCLKTIEIWDVGRIPATLVVKTDYSVDIEGFTTCGLLGNNMLLVEKPTSILVFLVDDIKKCIKLIHEISLEDGLIFLKNNSTPIFLNGSIFLLKATRDSTLMIFDLGKGEKIKEVQCPVMENEEGNVKIYDILTSDKSDEALVKLYGGRNGYYYYIFSLKQQVFLPDPFIDKPDSPACVEINKHYIAFGSMPSLTIIDYHTSEVIFKNEGQKSDIFPRIYKDSFIFLEWRDSTCLLKIFSLKTKTLTTLFEFESSDVDDVIKFQIVNGRFVILFNEEIPIAEFDPSSQTPGDIDFTIPFYNYNTEVNRSFTRCSCITTIGSESPDIYYYW